MEKETVKMGCKYSRFRVPSKREKCPPRVETAAGKRQTREMSGHVTLSVVRGKKNTRCLISLLAIADKLALQLCAVSCAEFQALNFKNRCVFECYYVSKYIFHDKIFNDGF